MIVAETFNTSERHYFEELREQTFAEALADGLEIVIPTSHQISLDIDRPWPERLAPRIAGTSPKMARRIIHGGAPKLIGLLWRFEEEFKITRREAWRSPGGNCHVLLTLDRDLDPTTRIALQSMLGSDPMRELLNLRRVLCGADDPIALFRPGAITKTDAAQTALSRTEITASTTCPDCGKPQYPCPSGVTCENGHGY